MATVKIEGTEKLSQRLKKLEEKLGRKEAVRILRKGSPPIKKEMKRLAPKKTGALQKSIVTRRGKKRRDLGENVLIGPKGGKGGAPYAHIQELGSRGGTYTAKGSGMFSFFTKGGGKIKVKSITRRGVKGSGFISKAFQTKSKDAENRIGKHIKKIVEA